MTKQRKNKYDAIIVGAGISGILSALALSKEGKKVLVVEKNNFIGGNCRTYENSGYHIDTGPHAITELTQGPLKQLINDYFTIVPRFFPIGNYFVRDKNKLQEFPLTLIQLAKFDILPKRERLIMSSAMIDAVANFSLNKKVLDKSIYEFMKKYKPAKKTLQIIDTISYFLSGRSMKETPTWRILGGSGYIDENIKGKKKHLKTLIKFTKNDYSSQGYPLGGIQSITNCAVNSIPKNNITFNLNEEVASFIVENNTIKGVRTNKDTYYSDFVIYSGFMKNLPNLTKELTEDYTKELAKLHQTKSLTIWLGLKKKLPELSYIGSEIYFNGNTPYWAIPVSNLDAHLAPKNKQLVGFSTIIKEDNQEDKINELRKTIFTAIPNIEKNVEFEHIQITIPEKAAVSTEVKFPSPKSPIKNLYLVGTDTDMRSMGITRASYSVVEALKFMKEDEVI